jgi:endonuclease G
MSGCPTGTSSSNEIIVRHLYAASINAQSGLADWVAYRVLGDSVGVASLLPRWWQQDDLLLPTASPGGREANGAGFTQPDLRDQPDQSYRINEFVFDSEDRGRLTPLTSFANTPYWEELNNLSNMTPIPVALRIGGWARMEQSINEYAAREGELFVISGPLYEISAPLNSRVSGREADNVAESPSAFFKIVATPTRHAAFLFDRDLPRTAGYCEQRSTIQTIEQRSGLNFLPDLPQQGVADLAVSLGCSAN